MANRNYQQRPALPADRTADTNVPNAAANRSGVTAERSVARAPRSPLHLQHTLGNQQVQRLLQREAAEAMAASESAPEQQEDDPLGLSPDEALLFQTIMAELSDDELVGALDSFEAEAESSAEPAQQGIVQAFRTPGLIQRGKKKVVAGIASATSPNHTLATSLETNSKFKPRLMRISRWKKIKKDHLTKRIRKYVAIRHQNLQDDTINEDLVLLIALRKRAKIGGKRDQHYSAIEAKSNKKNQTAQTRTELLGEAVSAIRMEGYGGGDCKLILGYASGAGIDQLWKSPGKKTYYVVEAKGPGAKLKVDVFAVRGVANGAGMTQMSQAWIEDRIPRLQTRYATEVAQLLSDCGLKITGGRLVNNPAKVGKYTLEGLVITANWDEGNADLSSGLSKKTYVF